MISIHVTACCERFSYANGAPTCTAQPIEFDHSPTLGELSGAFKKAGYVVDADGKHWCPRHAEQGERFTVAADWQEIAPGVMVRLPRPWGFEDIEVKRVAADG